MNIQEAVKELRKNEKKKFSQAVDLIINLRGVDIKRDNVSAIISLPHKIKDKKVCGFLTKKSELVKTITTPEFPKYKDKKELRKLVKECDFFIAVAPLMPSVATNFGKVLGPAGKMPSPQLGIITQETDAAIRDVIHKISTSMKIRLKEPSFKASIGHEGMKDEEIVANAEAVYRGFVNALPTKRENVRNVMIKFTMTKPIRVEMK